MAYKIKKTAVYRKYVIILFVLIFMYLCLKYICTWERNTRFEYRFISGVGEGISRKTGMSVVSECKCFPVLESGKVKYSFENGYGEGRTFGGKRRHEGIDIMSSKNKAGILKIRSVSDGVVEKKGWLRLGGYRIGIRSDSGNYYYYAHLDSYRKNLKCKDRVKAGEIIGYMGSTGYGAEGTDDKFPVHLHFGIYVRAEEGEKSINPYYLLRKLSEVYY